ncbi:MAG: sigma-54-dependent Fis family transcriptional regulator [Lentisphaerae bacterium]|nr:sigma-54-dependent Fis family transcriptional regulator [Lentisphaerota bacterium]
MAATNRDLKAAVEDGVFREDLYYRLNVVNVHLPPLRERGEDVSLLLSYFLQATAEENGKTLNGFTPEALKVLTAYGWPGNVRELRNCVERMVVMARGASLTLKDVPVDVRLAVGEELSTKALGSEPESGSEAALDIDTQERNLIVRALRETNGNRTAAAKHLGISRRTLHRKLHTYGLEDM